MCGRCHGETRAPWPSMRRTVPLPAILACDIGGTRIKVGIVRTGRLLAQSDLPAFPERGLASALRRVARTTSRLCVDAGLERRDLGGFALAFPGIIEPGTARILSTPAGKFDDARHTDVPQVIRKRLGLEAVVCNDANAALAGEWSRGAARGIRSAVMMTLGTGIGSSAIIDGVPLRGQHGQAGCLGGHLLANIDGGPCLCGNHGCAEAEASTWALPAQARAHPDFPRSRLARTSRVDFAAVFAAAEQGDAVARELRDRSLRVWAGALVSLIHAYDPEVAVIGGGILRSARVILPRLRQYVARHAWTPWGQVRVLPARLGNRAGMIGAASLFPTSS